MEKRYLLPLEAVVETMKWSADVVTLQAHLPSLPGISKDACLAQVVLGQGQIYSCTITTRAGALLREQREAYHLLEQRGDLEWSVLPVPSWTAPVSQKATSLRPNTWLIAKSLCRVWLIQDPPPGTHP